ncbi:uncharacterized protein [Notothenia coriiceps]|uniref:Ig-like domain-containing protein n=1 Tax=Notothenia coriiceps TaxID=8208 RepID=A0A6I9Q3V1_9TELE|nr:PREDICTED: uncharacterized protein LOC104965573 [Notothenia coriiceps]
MAPFYPQPLLLLLLLISECRGGSPVLVSTSLEEDVVLPCSDPLMTDKDTWFRVKLIKHATNSSRIKVIIARPEISKFKDAQRVKWQADKNGQMSITLTKSQKSDEGLYGCEIWKGWDSILVKNISLKVKDCKNLKPVKAALSTSVTLNCPVDITAGQQGPPNISWSMLKGGNPVPFNSKSAAINGKSVTIQSMNDNDSGWYRCNYTLDQTQRCFDINLLVPEEEQVVVDTAVPGLTTSEINVESDKNGISEVFLTVVVASVIAVIVIMAALMGLFIYCRRNSQTVTQQTQRPPAGSPIEYGGYEIVNTLSENRTNDQFTSLYQHFPDESQCTFWNE